MFKPFRGSCCFKICKAYRKRQRMYFSMVGEYRPWFFQDKNLLETTKKKKTYQNVKLLDFRTCTDD